MLRRMNDLENYAVRATDGMIGHVNDFYFDDETWVVRYLVIETGDWLLHRKVMISPIAINRPNWQEKILPVALTKEQVKNSPEIDTDKPVSRQHEMRYNGYFGYPYYWGGGGLVDGEYYPYTGLAEATESAADQTEAEPHENDDLHLRSCKAVAYSHIHATDGEIGQVSGMLADEASWAIRYLIVDTSNGRPGHQVLVAPQSIIDVNWSTATVAVNLTRQAVQDAPPYDPKVPMDQAQDVGIQQYYERVG
jgi:PRC-barrel domain